MVICYHCEKEMVCTKTGATIHYGNGHVYSGDAFGCSSCGAVVIHTDSAPYHDEDYWHKEYFLEMNTED